ncbi:LysM peptidoglycan-binding domain-containing protein [Pseudactinotalea sp. HY160]|uniref:LysM peptidoglycan-binding domain-containing protein n=1 Tax=Pseudactinotalea sp. HY160 TaxID=2654490 RepID=UPI00128AFF36|nr:LysM peptidoglycan-binding domain-containing protein [Pseudactinotalea sp. HY160]MPV49436.1 LysM peptidoglycan-binding domain-containing protein [Pseudactinotalea sp. HY160]
MTAAGAIIGATAVSLTYASPASAAPAHEAPRSVPPAFVRSAPQHVPTTTPTTPTAATRAVSAVPTAKKPGTITHRVVAGDTVWALAKTYRSSVPAIVRANDLDRSALIRIGQRLTIPAGSTPATSPRQPAQKPSTSAPSTGASSAAKHKVVSGDTVGALAIRYSSSVGAIVRANRLNAAAMIYVGQTLTIPGSAGGSTTAAPPSSPSSGGSGSSTSTGASSAGRHKVVSGDTVGALARNYGSTVAAIVKANGLNSAATIYVGQTLTIPGSGGGSGSSPAGADRPQLVPNTFLHYTYPDDVVRAANDNKYALLAMNVPSSSQLRDLIRSTARQYGVDPALALAIAQQESGINQRAVSPANAIGTMQVIPSTGAWIGGMVGRELNLLDARDNVTAGVRFIKWLTDHADSTDEAIGGYYQGLGSVQKYGLASDTRSYVANVTSLMTRFG